MRCYDCDAEYIELSGTLVLEDDSIGKYTIDAPKYFKCSKCGELLFPEETLAIIEQKEEEILNRMLGQQPIANFISSKEAAEILGISRQAFHKHRKIKNGFIYSVRKNGTKFFHKKSVELFKQHGDGRFSLDPKENTVKQNINTARYSSFTTSINKSYGPSGPYIDIINISPELWQTRNLLDKIYIYH